MYTSSVLLFGDIGEDVVAVALLGLKRLAGVGSCLLGEFLGERVVGLELDLLALQEFADLLLR